MSTTLPIALLTLLTAIAVPAETVWNLPRFDAVPVLDGVLDEAVWSDALAQDLDDPLLDAGFDASGHRTTLHLWSDGETLYVGADCRFPPGAPMPSDAEVARKPVLESDSLELFFAADGGRVATPIRHFAVNLAGARLERGGSGARGATGWRSAVKRGDGRWTVELAIPFADIGADSPGHYWHLNACRNLYGSKGEWIHGMALKRPGYLSPSVLLLAGPVRPDILAAHVRAALEAMKPLQPYLTGPDAESFRDLTALAERLMAETLDEVTPKETVRILESVAKSDQKIANDIILNYMFAEQP